MQNSKKILLIWDRLGDYHRARCVALADKIGYENVFSADLGCADSIYKWDNSNDTSYKHFTLSKKSVEAFDIFSRISNFAKIIKKNNIDVVCIAGYGRIEYVIMTIYSKLKGKKTVLFAESWYGSGSVSEKTKSFFINSFCDVLFVSGTKAKKHFIENLKINKNKIITGYSVVDNEHFANRNAQNEKQNEILCIARFCEAKNLTMLINSFLKSEINKKYSLRLIGGGELKNELSTTANNSDRIIIQDWISYNELPLVYAKAKILILPSIFEPWGLVVNEAMAAGLPIIVSEQCGCQPDLINDENGWIFDANELNSLSDCFNIVSQCTSEQLIKMGKKSQKTIANFSPRTWANNLLNSL